MTFDRAHPSPIATILELRARALGAVVAVEGMSALQREAYVPSGVEQRLLDVIDVASPPHLIVVSGSAGGGKSALLDQLGEAAPDGFDQVLQDATHSASPSASQADELARFFAPFADIPTEPLPSKPLLVAANTGMLLEFFRQLKHLQRHVLTELEAVLKYRLGISADLPPDVPWRLALINLDLRATAGQGGLLGDMLSRISFDRSDGLLAGAPRCDTCTVRGWCPVRANALLLSGSAAGAVDIAAAQAAVERGRHDAPRQLWDFISRLLTGDDTLDGWADPCDAVADAAAREDAKWVYDHLLPVVLFRSGGDVGERVQALDPSLRPSAQAHRILTSAGIVPLDDGAAIAALDPGDGAYQTAATWVAGGSTDPVELGRALAAAAYLQEPDEWELRDAVSRDFAKLLGEYVDFTRQPSGEYPSLLELRPLLERALAGTVGVLQDSVPYIPIKAYDPRDPSHVFVNGQLEYEENSYEVLKDPEFVRDPRGAELAGHRPLGLTIRLGGVEVPLTLPVFRLLRAAQAGTAASTADLERFYALRRAVDALARYAAGHGRNLLVDRPGTDRRYAVSKTAGLGGRHIVTVRELVG